MTIPISGYDDGHVIRQYLHLQWHIEGRSKGAMQITPKVLDTDEGISYDGGSVEKRTKETTT